MRGVSRVYRSCKSELTDVITLNIVRGCSAEDFYWTLPELLVYCSV